MARRRLPPLKALPAFEEAARHLSFSAAARELNLTHGAISRQMKSLETHLGVRLFRRLNRRVELTDAGAAFLPAARTALDVVEASAARLSAAYDDLERRIAELREAEELASIRPDLDGTQIMEILGITPGRDVGEAYRYLLELRMEHGPLGEEEARERLLAWWAERGREDTDS